MYTTLIMKDNYQIKLESLETNNVKLNDYCKQNELNSYFYIYIQTNGYPVIG